MKRLQVFVHRHYDTIKLVLLSIILAVASLSYLSLVHTNAESSKERGEGILRIIKEVKAQSDAQTEELERQLQAICFLVIETAGADALKELDPPLDERCKNLADGHQPSTPEEPGATLPSPVPSATTPGDQPAAPTKRVAPKTQRPPIDRPVPATPPKGSAPEREPGLIRGLLDGLLGGLI